VPLPDPNQLKAQGSSSTLGAHGSELRSQNSQLRAQSPGLRAQGSRLRAQSSGLQLRAQSSELGPQGSELKAQCSSTMLRSQGSQLRSWSRVSSSAPCRERGAHGERGAVSAVLMSAVSHRERMLTMSACERSVSA